MERVKCIGWNPVEGHALLDRCEWHAGLEHLRVPRVRRGSRRVAHTRNRWREARDLVHDHLLGVNDQVCPVGGYVERIDPHHDPHPHIDHHVVDRHGRRVGVEHPAPPDAHEHRQVPVFIDGFA